MDKLTITPEGNDVEHSLSLSTIVWALNQIKSAKENIKNCLDDKFYNDAIQELEKKFFDKDAKVILTDDKEIKR